MSVSNICSRYIEQLIFISRSSSISIEEPKEETLECPFVDLLSDEANVVLEMGNRGTSTICPVIIFPRHGCFKARDVESECNFLVNLPGRERSSIRFQDSHARLYETWIGLVIVVVPKYICESLSFTCNLDRRKG